MAKRWNPKSWVERIKKIKKSKKEQEVPFYLPGQSEDYKSSEGGFLESLILFFTKAFKIENREKVHKIFLGVFILSICWFTGSITALFLTPKSLTSKKINSQANSVETISQSQWQIKTNKIVSNDPFKSAIGKIIAKKKDTQKNCTEADKKSRLPLKLVDTIVLKDSVKSLASVQVRSNKDFKRIRTGERLENLAEIYKIERLRLNFKNLETGECEYIVHQKIEEEKRLRAPKVLKGAQELAAKEELKELEGIKQVGNKICLDRTMINEKLSNLGKILQDARAVQINNPDGTLSFKIVEITPGSIYSNLNIQNNDIIKSINGKAISGLNEIMGLFSKISSLPKLNLDLERGGSLVPMKYEFTKNGQDSCKE